MFFVPTYNRIGYFWSSFLLLHTHIRTGRVCHRPIGFIPSKTCNIYVRRIISRSLVLAPYWIYSLISYSRKIPLINNRLFLKNDFIDRFNLASKVSPVPFTFQEEVFANHWLESKGFKLEEIRIVCLFEGDSSDLSQPESPINDYKYLDQRDAEIYHAEAVITWILAKDPKAVVIRIASSAQDSLNLSHPRLIDYSFTHDQHPLLDIWFISKASLVISPDISQGNPAHFYNVPLIYLNTVPEDSAYLYSSCKCLVVINKLFGSANTALSSGETPPLPITNKAYESDSYRSRHNHVVKQEPHEILVVVKAGWELFIEEKDPNNVLARQTSNIMASIPGHQAYLNKKFFAITSIDELTS